MMDDPYIERILSDSKTLYENEELPTGEVLTRLIKTVQTKIDKAEEELNKGHFNCAGVCVIDASNDMTLLVELMRTILALAMQKISEN